MRARGAGGGSTGADIPGYEAQFTLSNNATAPTFVSETTTDAATFPGYFGGPGDLNVAAAGAYIVTLFVEWEESGGSPAAGTVMEVENSITFAGSGIGNHGNILILGPAFDAATIDWAGSGRRFWHPQVVTLFTGDAGAMPMRGFIRGHSTSATVQAGSCIVTIWRLSSVGFPGNL